MIGLVAVAALSIVVYRAEPTLRARVIETLSTRFKSKVELDAFHVSVIQGLQVSGSGLRIFGETDPNNHEPGFQPIINVAEFEFHIGIRDLFHTPLHVNTVFLKGLQLNLPPREHRSQSGDAPALRHSRGFFARVPIIQNQISRISGFQRVNDFQKMWHKPRSVGGNHCFSESVIGLLKRNSLFFKRAPLQTTNTYKSECKKDNQW